MVYFCCVGDVMLLTLSKRSNEQRLIQQAKDFSNHLAQQKYDLDKADMFPANATSEVSQMRESLLGYHNDLALTNERLYQLNYKIQWLINPAYIVSALLSREALKLNNSSFFLSRSVQTCNHWSHVISLLVIVRMARLSGART